MSRCNGHPGEKCICRRGDPCDYHAATCVTCGSDADKTLRERFDFIVEEMGREAFARADALIEHLSKKER